MFNLFTKKIEIVRDQYAKQPDHALITQLEKEIECYLVNNPHDSYTWLLYALFENSGPLYDPMHAINILEHLLSYDPLHLEASLLLVWIYYFEIGPISDNVFNRLSSLTVETKEEKALIAIAQSWYYQSINNDKAYVQSLLHAIDLCPYFANPYIDLGNFYMRDEEQEKAILYITTGLQKITFVFYGPENNRSDNDDWLTILNYYFKGIYITYPCLKKIYQTIGKELPPE